MNPGRRIPRYYVDMALLTVAEFFWAVGLYMYFNLLPLHFKSYIADEKLVSLILSVHHFAGILAFFGGFFTRRFNLKWLTFLCWAVPIPAPLFFAFSTGAPGFITGQVFYSLTTAFSPAVVLYIFDYHYEGDKMGPYLLYSLAATLPVMIAPAIGGAVASAWGMRIVFLIAAGLLALGSMFILFITPLAPRKPVKAAPGEPGAAPSGRRNRLYAWLLIMILATFSQSIAEPMLSLFMRQQNAMSVEQIGIAFTLSGLGGFLLTFPVRKYGPRFRPWAVLGALSLLVCTSNLVLQAGSIALIFLAMPMRGAARSALFYAQGTVSTTLDGPDKGLLVGGFIAIRSLSFTLATNLGGVLYTVSPTMPFWIEIAGMALWALLYLLYERLGRRPEKVNI